MKLLVFVLALLVAQSVGAVQPRSAAAKQAFARIHPCPATGLKRASCPGYVIDHIKPLACGGPDKPSNMQWQTIAEGKAKDRWELKQCRPKVGH